MGDRAGLQPSGVLFFRYLGRWPRLEWGAPLALESDGQSPSNILPTLSAREAASQRRSSTGQRPSQTWPSAPVFVSRSRLRGSKSELLRPTVGVIPRGRRTARQGHGRKSRLQKEGGLPAPCRLRWRLPKEWKPRCGYTAKIPGRSQAVSCSLSPAACHGTDTLEDCLE